MEVFANEAETISEALSDLQHGIRATAPGNNDLKLAVDQCMDDFQNLQTVFVFYPRPSLLKKFRDSYFAFIEAMLSAKLVPSDVIRNHINKLSQSVNALCHQFRIEFAAAAASGASSGLLYYTLSQFEFIFSGLPADTAIIPSSVQGFNSYMLSNTAAILQTAGLTAPAAAAWAPVIVGLVVALIVTGTVMLFWPSMPFDLCAFFRAHGLNPISCLSALRFTSVAAATTVAPDPLKLTMNME